VLRVLIFLGVVLALAFGFAWLADRPGSVAIDWMGYQIELSAMVAMVGLLVLIVTVMTVWGVLKLVVRSPAIMGGYFASRRRDRGYDALSGGLIAAGSGDTRATQRHAKQAMKLLPDAPLTQVLAASSADLAGDAEAKRRAYRTMLDDPKTQLLGLRGLYLDAVSDDDEEAARHYAQQAAALAPALPWAGEAQFEDQVQNGEWAAARSALERNLQAKIITKVERNRLRAVLLTAEALEREQGEPDAARALALEAHKLAVDLVPAAAVAGRLLIRAGKMTQASKVIEATWKKALHPELAEVYLYVRPGDAIADRVKRARKLVQLCAHELEGELALARTLMEAGKLDEARDCLKAFTGPEATQRVCLLMAEIEEQAGGETTAVRGWMARALRAKRDSAWVADGYVSSTWEPVSPLSGRVDAFEWRVPLERFVAHEPVSIPEDTVREDGRVMLPARLPQVEAQDVEPQEAKSDSGTGTGDVEEPVAAAIPVKDAELAMPDPSAEPEQATAPDARELTGREDAPTAVIDGDEPVDGKADEPDKPIIANDDAIPASQSDEEGASEAADPNSSDAQLAGRIPDAVIDGTDEESGAPGKAPYRGLPDGHAPDDPGTQDAEEMPEERRRFRLF
jgi:HemY protein